jgi:uncharacterized protein YndB with AHSA1/START domain
MSDWSSFTKRITIDAEADEIYRALASQSGIESWFLRIAQFTSSDGTVRHRQKLAEKGDRYFWAWHGWGDAVNQRGEILEVNGKNFVQFTFHDPMIVSIRVLNEHNSNVVELVQTNIPLDEDSRRSYFVGCGEGWTFYLTNLKSVLEGGLDLRNKDENIKCVVNS